MEQNLTNAQISTPRPCWDRSRLVSRIVHLGCGAFHRAHETDSYLVCRLLLEKKKRR